MAQLTGEEVVQLMGEEVAQLTGDGVAQLTRGWSGSVDGGGSGSVDVFLLAEHYSLHAFEKVLGSNPSTLKEGALTQREDYRQANVETWVEVEEEKGLG